MNQQNIFQGKILNLFDVVTVITKLKSKYIRFKDHIEFFLKQNQSMKKSKAADNSKAKKE